MTRWLLKLPLLLATAAGTAAAADITGVVRDATTGLPIADAQVHLRARDDVAPVRTGADGRFVLPVDGIAGNVQVSVARAYDPHAAVNYETTAVSVWPGADIVVSLRRIPAAQDLAYQPIAAAPPAGCGSCHVEQYAQWSASNHAHAARNRVVRDLYSGDGTSPRGGPASNGYVFLDRHAPPATGFCAVCHAPNERPADPGSVRFDAVASAPGLEGVTCTSCHQLHDVEGDVRAIHLLGDATFSFPAATGGGGASLTHQHVWGPLDDVNFGQMRAAWAPVFATSRLCGSCHEYDNPVTGAPGQTTFTEWLDSPAAVANVPCQGCHMPAATTAGRLAAVGAAPQRPAAQRHDHGFPGVYSSRLGTPVALDLSARAFGDRVDVVSVVRNLVQGHRFPTGVDVRNAFVVVEASLDGVPLPQVAGDRVPDWASDDVPGRQPGDFGGAAGRGFAKVLEGRIDGAGDVVSPVPFIDAERELSQTTIQPGGVDVGQYRFALPDDVVAGARVELQARVVYRRAWRAIAVSKQWPDVVDGEPWERLVAERLATVVLDAAAMDGIWVDGFETVAPVD